MRPQTVYKDVHGILMERRLGTRGNTQLIIFVFTRTRLPSCIDFMRWPRFQHQQAQQGPVGSATDGQAALTPGSGPVSQPHHPLLPCNPCIATPTPPSTSLRSSLSLVHHRSITSSVHIRAYVFSTCLKRRMISSTCARSRDAGREADVRSASLEASNGCEA